MIRVLHVLQTPRAEGTPNLVLDWLAAGRDRLWQGVLVLNREPADLSDRLRFAADDYEEHHLLGRRWRKYPAMTATTFRAVRRVRPDVLVCWTTGFANWVCVGATAAGCRQLLVHAGNPPVRGRWEDWTSRYGMWPLAAVGAKVVCCSRYVRDAYHTIPFIGIRKFYAVHNCTRGSEVAARSVAARDKAGPHPPTAVMVATLESHKDHETLLRAVPSVLARVPNFRLRLVGDGRLRSRIELLIADLGIESAIELLGSRSDVPELLGTADLFVFSTTPREGLGSVLIEALAAGLRVVASDVPACREMLDEGRWGILFPPNDPVALSNVLVSALTSPPSKLDTTAGVEHATRLTADRMMVAYLSLAGVERLQ